MGVPAKTTLLVAAALGGCGGEREDAARVAREFQRSVSAQDSGAACAVLAGATREKLERDEGAPCSEALGKLRLEGSGVTRTDVFVSAARVSLSNGEFAFLGRTPNGWRVSSAGCKPAARDRPYDCELES